MISLKICAINDSLGIIFPTEVIERLSLQNGDQIFLKETSNHGYEITQHNSEFDRQIAIFEEGMNRYDTTLQALAQ